MANSMMVHAMVIAVCLLHMAPNINAWGKDGHEIICKIAQERLTESAASAVKELLPEAAEGDLSSYCLWADRIKFRYRWSSPLHYINTPDVCNYNYNRDCKDEDGEKGRCVAGAINNYTTQLLTYNTEASSKSKYNLTEALLFLSHFMGDVHQPLHTGFASDKGGNTIEVHWYRRKTNLHHIWDTELIETAVEKLYDTSLDDMIGAIEKNITKEWASDVKRWESCSRKTACPDIYASEGIKAACDWAYKGVKDSDTLDDDYFYSRTPTVHMRLAQSAVRLAATLNKIFSRS